MEDEVGNIIEQRKVYNSLLSEMENDFDPTPEDEFDKEMYMDTEKLFGASKEIEEMIKSGEIKPSYNFEQKTS